MQKVILITGISSGFGKKTAELLAEKGNKVYGTVRKDTDINPLVNILKMDLTDQQSVQLAVNQVLQKEGRIDVLVNNAGMHTGGSIETTAVENAKMQLDTNIMGMVYMLREVLPAMRKQMSGTIINLGSIGGLKPFNINVVVINPGDFHTNNTANRRNFLANSANDPYAEQFAKTLAVIEKDENAGWAPDVLARKLVKIIETKNPCHRYVIASAEQKLAVLLKRILPSGLFMKILAPHYGIK